MREVRKSEARKKSLAAKEKENLFERLVADSAVRREKRELSQKRKEMQEIENLRRSTSRGNLNKSIS